MYNAFSKIPENGKKGKKYTLINPWFQLLFPTPQVIDAPSLSILGIPETEIIKKLFIATATNGLVYDHLWCEVLPYMEIRSLCTKICGSCKNNLEGSVTS